MSETLKPKAIAIVGTTASGKTSLSIEIAKQFNGEVISADSRQVYRGLDIGSAKVTSAEMDDVPHHLINIADPTDIYTGSNFKRDGDIAMDNIISRDKTPIIAGGTFFYLELLKGTTSSAPVPPNPSLRTELEQKSCPELYAELLKNDPARAATIDKDNPRRLVRALEIIETLGTVPTPTETNLPYNWLTLGIDIPQDILSERIYTRIIERLKIGMVEEVEQLHHNGVSWEKLDSFGLEYRYIARFLQNMLSRDEMITELTNKTRQFSKRQRTWLKRDPSIIWLPFPVDTGAVIDITRNFIEG
jgi:tRNA dimethylallyltransferase